MVSVLCTTYNHEKFVRDAIEGVLNQKTDFKIELIIHDDASTDNTQKIIKEYADKYPDIIRPILQKENQFRRVNIYTEYIYPCVQGKYIAMCEGDDYWIDNDKLQKQIDFLEAHVDYSMSMHNAVKLNYETGEKKLLDTFPEDGTYSQEEQLLAGLGTDYPAFASYVLRTEILRKMPEFFLRAPVGDYPYRQYFANEGKVYYFKKPMSVYRVGTPDSYMKNTANSLAKYNAYTLGMIRFFEQFDDYTGKKFHSIIDCKVTSDYLGFCLSADEKEGLEKGKEQGLNIDKLKECYNILSPVWIDESIIKLKEKTEHLFIYGTSRIAPICRKQLENSGIDFESFVVSDSQMKQDSLDGKPVIYLSEAMRDYSRPGFILAVQPINVEAIEKVLKQYGAKDYCAPYKLGECV